MLSCSAVISGLARCIFPALFCCIIVSGNAQTRMTHVAAAMAAYHSIPCARWKYSMTYMSPA
eukprot:23774-Pelagococcus_subviridis.AAC.1